MKRSPELHVILVNPEIPPNTGNIARLCGATGTPLHLVHPLGFSTDAKALRRAGLDYWSEVEVHHHPDFKAALASSGEGPLVLFSARATRSYLEAPITTGARLIFGSETKGLPAEIIESYPDALYRIPIWGKVRSLNLSTAAGIAVYEAYRRLGTLQREGAPQFAKAPGLPGKLYQHPCPGARKHPCPDCFECGWCSEERCGPCMSRRGE